MKYLMGIDNGGTAVKAGIFDLDGNQICVVSSALEMLKPEIGFTERDLLKLWQTNAKVIKECIEKSKLDKNDIAALAVTGHGKGLYLLDKNNKPLYNGIISTDNRALSYEQKAIADGTADRIYNKTFQKVIACQPICLLQWLKDNKRDIYDNIGAVLSVKDFIRFHLTGEVYNEITDISGTNLFNLKTRDYDEQLLKEFNIEEIKSSLPPVKNSSDICGKITEKAAEQTGLKKGTLVAGGMFDIDACALGMGINNDENICSIAGTWSINEYISSQPITDKSVSMNSFYCIPNYYLIEECSATSSGNLEWFLNNFYAEEKRTADTIESFYKLINKQVADILPEQTDILFLPFLFVSNEYRLLKSGFYNLTAKADKSSMLRAVYEGIVFSHKSHIDKLLSNGKKPKAIRLAGGAANSEIWSQMFADVMQQKIETVKTSQQGCLGAAMSAGIAAHLYKDYNDAVQKTIKVEKVYYADKNKAEIYSEKYSSYRKLVKALESYYI